MDYILTWDFWKKALIRALHTMAQTALGMLAVGMAIKDVDWLHMLSVAAVAGVISLLKSVVVGVPETEQNLFQVTLSPDEQDEESDVNELLDKFGELNLDFDMSEFEEGATEEDTYEEKSEEHKED